MHFEGPHDHRAARPRGRARGRVRADVHHVGRLAVAHRPRTPRSLHRAARVGAGRVSATARRGRAVARGVVALAATTLPATACGRARARPCPWRAATPTRGTTGRTTPTCPTATMGSTVSVRRPGADARCHRGATCPRSRARPRSCGSPAAGGTPTSPTLVRARRRRRGMCSATAPRGAAIRGRRRGHPRPGALAVRPVDRSPARRAERERPRRDRAPDVGAVCAARRRRVAADVLRPGRRGPGADAHRRLERPHGLDARTASVPRRSATRWCCASPTAAT